MQKVCQTCGRVFTDKDKPNRSAAQWAKLRFCSNVCRGAELKMERNICACGCGLYVSKTTSRYRQGHKRRQSRLLLWEVPGRKPRIIFRDRSGKKVYFARAVMECHLGRHLLPGEVVHHLNGDSLDDRIENLSLYASHSEHMKDEYLAGQLVGLAEGPKANAR